MAVVAWPPPTPPNTRTNATDQLDAHPSDHNRIADALDTIVAQLDVTAWAALTLGSGWSWIGGGFAKPGYRRALGMIQVQGVIQGPASPGAGSTVFTLPAGFRPAAVHRLGQMCNSGLALIEVATTGAATWGGALTGSTGGFLTLNMAFPLVAGP